MGAGPITSKSECNVITNMPSAAIVYARTDSERLPQKALRPFAGTNLISHVLRRACRLDVDRIILATTTRSCDDVLVQHVKALNKENEYCREIDAFRGDCDDVVQRTKDALSRFGVRRFARINGDCPFFPVAALNGALHDMQYQFINNIRLRNWPYGMAVEVLDADFYLQESEFVSADLREHTTAHLYRCAKYPLEKNLAPIETPNNSPARRFTIDTKEEYECWSSFAETRNLDHFFDFEVGCKNST